MKNNLAIYIHWPFCKSKCPYCDFNSHVSESINHDAWRQAYLQEIKHYANKLGPRKVTSIFFGGGTPSLMQPETVSAIIDEISKRWNIANDVEITLEANPTSVEIEKLRSMKNAGVNRVSVGIQSFDDNNLKFLGREHSAKEAMAALEEVQSSFDNFSFDLIYALPEQTVADVKKEIKQAMEFCRKHISMYQLTIEKGTPFFGDHAMGKFKLPDEDVAVDMYETVDEMLGKHGLQSYEVSNYASAGFESRHNLAYWKYGEYVGIGPGAHGRIANHNGRVATVNIYHPQRWLASVEAKGAGLQNHEPIEGQAYLEEYLLMGLRLAEGISKEDFFQRIGQQPEEILQFSKLVKSGFLEVDKQGFRTSKKGRLLLNHLLSALITK